MTRNTRLGALRRWLAVPLLALGVAASALAQSYPARAVRIVIPYPPGGGIDVLVRSLAAELTGRWGQPVLIENRAGGNSLIGAEAVARSAPDGYTLFAAIDQTFVVNRFLYKSLPYDPERSFAPITLMVAADHLLVANSATPVTDLKSLVALARREPRSLRYGSFGDGTQPQLLYETLNQIEGIDLLHVPYKGVAQLMTGVAGNEVHLATGSSGVTGTLIKAGRLKPLAVAGRERNPVFPDVPTTTEQGYPQLLASIWFGLFAPAGTPAAVIEKVHGDVRDILRAPAFAEREATSKGWRVVAGTPAELAATIRDQTALTIGMIRAAGIQPQ